MSSSRSVLVVEDHDDSRELLADFLGLSGFDVHTASNGIEAIRLAEQHCPRVVLMDLMLPEMDGFETTRRIKQHPRLRDTVVIAMTAQAFPSVTDQAIDAGCHTVLTKPFDISELAVQVHHVVHGSASSTS